MNDHASLPLISNIYQYADDTALILANENYSTAAFALQEDIKQIMNWFVKNFIFVNENKTSLMCFRTHQKRIHLTEPNFLHSAECRYCCCSPLAYATATKYLGIYFDEHLSWNLHTDNLIKQLRMISSYLYRLRSHADITLRRTVYQMLGESKLRYGITIYAFCSNTKKQKIDKMIKRMVKNVTYGTRLEHIPFKEQLTELNLLAIGNLRNYTIISSNYFTTDYKTKSTRQKQLRRTKKYNIPRVYTNYGTRSTNYYVPNLFNQLPGNLQEMQSLRTVKKEILKWCQSRSI